MKTTFDIKIACHLLEPDLSDDNLELDKLMKKYNTLNTAPTSNDAKSLGVIASAIKNLHIELRALLDMEVVASLLSSLSSLSLFY